jgi:nesprin-1
VHGECLSLIDGSKTGFHFLQKFFLLIFYEFLTFFFAFQDEQERVQKKTFVNWINSYLAKRNPPMRIEELFYDLRDGTKLIALLEILSGDRLPVEKGRNMKRPHFLSNANTALQFLASKRIKLVNINSADLVDGKPAVVLGLIWTIILYFQVTFLPFPFQFLF